MDGRFYVMSLAAIFLALALGILLGVHLPGAEALLVSEERLVAGIEREMDRLLEDRAAMRRELEEARRESGRLQSELDELLSLAVDSRLQGIHIARVGDAGEETREQLQRLATVLRAAGAEEINGADDADILLYSAAAAAETQPLAPVTIRAESDGRLTVQVSGRELEIPDVNSAPGLFRLIERLVERKPLE